MAKDQSGKNSAKPIVLFLLVILLIAGGLLFTYLVYPEVLHEFAEGFANQTLVEENQALAGKLNLTEAELAQVSDDRDRLAWSLREEQAKRILWPVLIALLVLIAVLAYLWHKHKQGQRGLTMDEAKRLFLPRVRKTFGFSQQEFPNYPKITGWASERVGHTTNTKDEAYFFIEYEFYPKNGQGYVRGLRSSQRNVVTMALLNFRYETHQREMPGSTLQMAIDEAHRTELWGFHLQKSQREDDINKLIQDANSIREIKKAVADEQEEAAS